MMSTSSRTQCAFRQRNQPISQVLRPQTPHWRNVERGAWKRIAALPRSPVSLEPYGALVIHATFLYHIVRASLMRKGQNIDLQRHPMQAEPVDGGSFIYPGVSSLASNSLLEATPETKMAAEGCTIQQRDEIRWRCAGVPLLERAH